VLLNRRFLDAQASFEGEQGEGGRGIFGFYSSIIKNKRRDFLHKEATKIAKKYHSVFVGDVGGNFVQSGNGKSSTDASIGVIRDLLKYKAIRHSGYFFEVNENPSTITCSTCHKKTGPSGLRESPCL
jgi:transposase